MQRQVPSVKTSVLDLGKGPHTTLGVTFRESFYPVPSRAMNNSWNGNCRPRSLWISSMHLGFPVSARYASKRPALCSSKNLLPHKYCHPRARIAGGTPFRHRSFTFTTTKVTQFTNRWDTNTGSFPEAVSVQNMNWSHKQWTPMQKNNWNVQFHKTKPGYK